MRKRFIARGIRGILLGLVVGSLGLGSYASAGFQNPPPPGSLCQVAARIDCSCPMGTPAKAACDYKAARDAYYAAVGPNEMGPYLTKQTVLHGALMASYWNQAGEAYQQGEWGSMIYVDKYGMYWFTAPIRGVQLPDGSWSTTLFPSAITRPGSQVVMVEHTHPHGLWDPTGSDSVDPDGDNQSDYPMMVIRADDTLWYFPPNTQRALYYGLISDGQVQTKYTAIGTTGDIDFTSDPYKIAQVQGKHWYDADYTWIGYAAGITLITSAASTVVVLVLIGAFGDSGGTRPDSPLPPSGGDCGLIPCGMF
jgi:hypothetical protein